MNRTATLLVAVLTLTACETTGSPAAPQDGAAPAELPSGTVTRVNDGDSLVIDSDDGSLEVRMQGVNAPEQGECFYEEARGNLTALVDGATVSYETSGSDQFGRSLAYLWLGEDLVNLELVSGGFAVATTPGEGESYGDLIVDAEESAISSGSGLWSVTACGASPPRLEIAVDPDASNIDPRGPDEDLLDEEWVSFRADAGHDLAGWTVRDESSAHRCTLPPTAEISPDRPLVVTSADPCWVPGDVPVWNNGGDLVLLQDESGRIVAWLRYRG